MEKIKILKKENATHDVVHLVTEKPENIQYKPGQAVDIAIDNPTWKNEIRPFTFTSLPEDDHLEFHIKTYPDHNGVTEQIGQLKAGDHLLIGEVFGDIAYKDEGIFLAGGAGITPFIAILKDLKRKNKIGNNKLLFANKKEIDIVESAFFRDLLHKNFINILSDEDKPGYEKGFISRAIIEKYKDIAQPYYYLCGPPPMMDAVTKHLVDMDVAESYIIKEAF
ncbi:MAG: flavodoxin reductase [Chitinophagaceae bacterium]|nr:flavodoxin reductase [Chitinophagaceae bacterium]